MSNHLISEHLFSLSLYRLEKHVVISSAEVKVIIVYPWVCAGPKKSKKEPERRWRWGWGVGTRKRSQSKPHSSSHLVEGNENGFGQLYHYNSLSSNRCQQNFHFDFMGYFKLTLPHLPEENLCKGEQFQFVNLRMSKILACLLLLLNIGPGDHLGCKQVCHFKHSCNSCAVRDALHGQSGKWQWPPDVPTIPR